VFSRRTRFPRAAFPSALKSGRRLSSAHFSAVLPEEGKGYAVVVSKKVARLSVTRHRIKRRVLMALRTLPLPPALIIFPKASADSVSYQDIQAELAVLLSKNHH
jgi:ribonuclease P protein component